MKRKNKVTKVQPKSLAESSNKTMVKKKNRNDRKKKNQALKNLNGNIGTLVSDASVVVTSTISEEGKKKNKKKKNKKNKNLEPLNKSTCKLQADVTMKDVPTVSKENKDISDANDSANLLGNKNIEGNVPMSETVISMKNEKDAKESTEVAMDDKENIDDNAEISMKDIDLKTENSVINTPMDCESTISKKSLSEGEAVMKDTEINGNSESLMKDIEKTDQKAYKSEIDVSVTSVPIISKEKKTKKKQQHITGEALIKDLEINDNAETPKEDIENVDEKAENSQIDVSMTNTSTISKKKKTKKKQKLMIQGDAPVKDKEEINDNAETPKEDIENEDEKAENPEINISLTNIPTSKKKKKQKKKQQQVEQRQEQHEEEQKQLLQPVTEVTLDNSVAITDETEEKQQLMIDEDAPMKDKEEINDNAETRKEDIENVDEKAESSQIDISLTNVSTSKKKKKKQKKKQQQEEQKQQQHVIEGEAVIKDPEEINYIEDTPKEDEENLDEKAGNTQVDISSTNISTPKTKKKKKKKKKQQQEEEQNQQQQLDTEVTLDNSVDTKNETTELSGVSTNNPDGDPDEPVTDSTKKKKKRKKKRKISEVESTTTGTGSDVKASKIVREESEIEMSMQKGSKRNIEEEERTIFLGNVNIKTKRRDLARFFSKYGKVDTVRIRCAAVADPKKSKRVTVITGNYNNLRTSVNAYVRFMTKDMMTAALEANGVEFMGKHLRVDKALQTEDESIRHSVFIGNLPVEAEEEALRSHFVDCGKIHSVRIIRDKDFTSGKGFAFINFMSPDSIEFALQLNNSLFMHRQLRVQRFVKKGKNKKKSKNIPGKKGVGVGFVNLQKARTESNKPKGDSDFSGMKMVETKKFKKMKKAKGKLSEENKKKLAVSRMLTGVKAKLKKTT